MTYKILSLDGGGTWALIEVKALMNLFGPNETGRNVLSKFDMAVANSGGSIVLGGLLEDKPLSTILAYFMDEKLRRSIFQPTERVLDGLVSNEFGIGPRFSAKKKLPALQRLLPLEGGKNMTEVAAGLTGASSAKDVHVLIVGFDFDRNIAAFFRSAPSGGPEWGDGAPSAEVTLAEAIHASSNAPVQFFDEPAAFGLDRYWDGAIAGCNNPVLAGVAEAITLGIAPGEIRALSIGTGTVRSPGPPAEDPPPFVSVRSPQSVANDLKKLAASITDDPPDIASFLAHVMTGGGAALPAPFTSRIVRLNPMVSPRPDGHGGWLPPGNWTKEQLGHLAGIDMAALDPADIDYIADYADLWISDNAPNQPIRMDADSLASKLGPTTYSTAVAAWSGVTA